MLRPLTCTKQQHLLGGAISRTRLTFQVFGCLWFSRSWIHMQMLGWFIFLLLVWIPIRLQVIDLLISVSLKDKTWNAKQKNLAGNVTVHDSRWPQHLGVPIYYALLLLLWPLTEENRRIYKRRKRKKKRETRATSDERRKSFTRLERSFIV